MPEEWKTEMRDFEKTVWYLNFYPYSEAVSIPNIVAEIQKDKTLMQLTVFVRKRRIPQSAGEEWNRY